MIKRRLLKMDRSVLIYFGIISLTALGLGLSNDVLANYFKDAYNVTAFQRGLIELPREIPGVLIMIMVVVLSSFLSDVRIAMLAQFFSLIGIAVLGFFTPSFSVMLIFIFINSTGMHLFFPVQDSIGLSLIKDDKIGKQMGRYKGASTAFTMIGGMITFIGFKFGFFSFTSSIKWVFVLSAIVFAIVFVLFLILDKITNYDAHSSNRFTFVLRREYKFYYTLVILFGVQKQMMIVFGPWVLIEVLSKKADTLAILGMMGAFAGVFFIPAIGRLLDRFGIKTILYIDAISFIGVYLVYGILTSLFVSGKLALVGFPVIITYLLFIVDKMSHQLGMVGTIYLRSIAVETSDITPTLSLGLSLDHIISIISALVGGFIWKIWGQHVFFMVAGISLINLYVAYKVPDIKFGLQNVNS